ncbi:MAG: hypothetical protein NVS3B14_02180 [Ktedonobacteraceae bacterium]
MTEVNQETDTLIQHIAPAEPTSNGSRDEAAREASPKVKKARKGTSPASAKLRSRKAGAKQPDTNPATPHLRPSRRGFKWPEQEQIPEQVTEQSPEE